MFKFLWHCLEILLHMAKICMHLRANLYIMKGKQKLQVHMEMSMCRCQIADSDATAWQRLACISELTCIFWKKIRNCRYTWKRACADAKSQTLMLPLWDGIKRRQRSQMRRTSQQQQQEPNNVSNYLSQQRSPPKADRLPAVNPFHWRHDLHRWCSHVCVCAWARARAPSNWLAVGFGSHGPHTHDVACSPRFVKTSLDARTHHSISCRPWPWDTLLPLQFANSAPVPVRSIYLLADADQANCSVECSFRALSRLKSLSFYLSHQVDGLQVVVCMVSDSIALRPLWVAFLWPGSVGRYLRPHRWFGQTSDLKTWNGLAFSPRFCSIHVGSEDFSASFHIWCCAVEK